LVNILVEAIEVSIELEETIQLAHEVLRKGAAAASGCGSYASAGGSIRLRTVVGLPTLLPLILRVLHGSGSDEDVRRAVQRQVGQIGACSGALYGGAGQDGCGGYDFMRWYATTQTDSSSDNVSGKEAAGESRVVGHDMHVLMIKI
jgi:hypothetical protein